MIAPTKDDIGRRVRLARWPEKRGKVVDNVRCEMCGGIQVHYERETTPVCSDPALLDWSDGDLL